MPEESREQRIIALESSVMHLQYDFEKLNEAILEQQAAIRTLHEALSRLEARIEAGSPPEDAGPPEERPPHY